jgi:MFS superfamily sulfate permease-like transporter
MEKNIFALLLFDLMIAVVVGIAASVLLVLLSATWLSEDQKELMRSTRKRYCLFSASRIRGGNIQSTDIFLEFHRSKSHG